MKVPSSRWRLGLTGVSLLAIPTGRCNAIADDLEPQQAEPWDWRWPHAFALQACNDWV